MKIRKNVEDRIDFTYTVTGPHFSTDTVSQILFVTSLGTVFSTVSQTSFSTILQTVAGTELASLAVSYPGNLSDSYPENSLNSYSKFLSAQILI